MNCTQQSLPVACLPQSQYPNNSTQATPISIERMIRQIRNGEVDTVFDWAFQEVFPVVRARFGGNGLGITTMHELFTDAVLDLISALQKNADLDGRNLAGYLWRIFRNKRANWYRAAARIPDATLCPWFFGTATDPDWVLMTEVLQRQLNQLPASYREIIRLYYFEKLSCAEIATQLGSTAQSVKTRKCRAIQNLRTFFLEYPRSIRFSNEKETTPLSAENPLGDG